MNKKIFYEHYKALVSSGNLWYTEISTDTQYRFDYHEFYETLYIDFQAAQSRTDWFMAFWFWRLRLPFGKRMSAHAGFRKKYLSIRKYIHTAIKTYNPKKIVLRGYSKGGAISSICFYDIIHSFPSKEIEVFSYGAPRVFPWRINKELFIGFNRIVMPGDLVTNLPPIIFGYTHIGKKYNIIDTWNFPLPKYHNDNLYLETLKEESELVNK